MVVEIFQGRIQPLAEHPGGFGTPDLTAQDDEIVRFGLGIALRRPGNGTAGNGQDHEGEKQQGRQYPAEKIMLEKMVYGDQGGEAHQRESGEFVAGQAEKQEGSHQRGDGAEEPFGVDSFHKCSFLP